MALPLGTGLRLACYIDGVKQVLINDISVSQEDNSQDIDTLEGWVGVSPGTVKYQVTGQSALLTSGPEFDFRKEAAARTIHFLSIPEGADFVVLEGVFKNPGWKGGVNQNSEQSWTFTGRDTADE